MSKIKKSNSNIKAWLAELLKDLIVAITAAIVAKLLRVAERGESPSLRQSITYSSAKNNMRELLRTSLVILAAIYFGKAFYCFLRLMLAAWRCRHDR